MTQDTKPIAVRIVPWPGVRLPVPQVPRLPVMGTDGPWIRILNRVDGFIDLPERLYSNECRDIDAQRPEGLVGLTELLGGHVVALGRDRWRDAMSPQMRTTDRDIAGKYEDLVSYHSERLGLGSVERGELVTSQVDEGTEFRLHVAEVAMRVWTLQAVVRLLSMEAEPVSDPAGASAFPNRIDKVWAPWAAGAYSLLLRPFGPHLGLELGDMEITERAGWPPTAFEVAALQLYNDLGAGGKFKVCPRCMKPFIWQRDRAKYPEEESHRRSDAIYCNRRCAQSAADARYRAKKRQERTSGSSQGGHREEAR